MKEDLVYKTSFSANLFFKCVPIAACLQWLSWIEYLLFYEYFERCFDCTPSFQMFQHIVAMNCPHLLLVVDILQRKWLSSMIVGEGWGGVKLIGRMLSFQSLMAKLHLRNKWLESSSVIVAQKTHVSPQCQLLFRKLTLVIFWITAKQIIWLCLEFAVSME
jgi:hypothetical protein